jgi:hypothetical protein
VFRTGGFVTVEKAARGPVDTPADDRRSVFRPSIEHSFGGGRRIFGTAEFFTEQRANGTPLQVNDTNLRNFSAGMEWDKSALGSVSVRAYGGTQNYHQSFSAVPADRHAASSSPEQKPGRSAGEATRLPSRAAERFRK